MSSYNPFSYREYKEIVNKYRDTICKPTDALSKSAFTIIRHDVEFSVVRAYKLALMEAELNVSSTFFFQCISNAYNITSQENRKIIRSIQDMGHSIGLHLYISHVIEQDWDMVFHELCSQKQILENITEKKTDIFAFHRPAKWVLENRSDIIDGMINIYGESFFEFSTTQKHIKYLADSMHRWNFGHPLENHKFEKFQINTHPDEWTNQGLDEYENFKSLIDEHSKEFMFTIDNECKHFKPYLERFSKY